MNVGRDQFPDIVSSVNDFSFTPTSKRATQGFDIKNDAILEYDELFMAEFDISSLIDAGWSARKGDIPVTYIAIEDDDCEYMYACWYIHFNYAHVHISIVTMIAIHDISRYINSQCNIIQCVFIMIEEPSLLGVTVHKPVHRPHVSQLTFC